MTAGHCADMVIHFKIEKKEEENTYLAISIHILVVLTKINNNIRFFDILFTQRLLLLLLYEQRMKDPSVIGI